MPHTALAAPVITTQPPQIDYALLAPLLVVFAAGVIGVLVEAFVPRPRRRAVQFTLAALALVAAFVLTVVRVALLPAGGAGLTVASASIAVDRPTLFFQGTILVMAIASLLLIAEHRHGESAFAAQAATVPGSEEERAHVLAGSQHTEVYPLVLFAVLGMLMFPASNDFLTMFIALEVMSLPLYLLCGLARRRRLFSQEAAVKYFLLGAFSSAFFLFGIAMVYGYAGSVNFAVIHDTVAAGGAGALPGGGPLLLLGIALVGVGLLFKVGAVPFHSWKPDVYQGAPTPITALMASGTLVAAFGALLRVFYVAFGGSVAEWRPMMWVVAVLTMVLAAVVAVTQRDIKRLLAYSSVVHAGFVLTAVVAASAEGLAGAMFYLAAYGFTTVGAFAVVTLVRVHEGGAESGDIASWAGLGRTSPVLAGSLALFLLAFAGIPLTSGFIGKFAVFEAAVSAGATPLVVVGVLSSAVTAFFYVRIIVLMFFAEPAEARPRVLRPGRLTGAVIGVGVVATLVLGVFPGPVLDRLSPAPGAGTAEAQSVPGGFATTADLFANR
ncbi:NADH-quinone oxidoreductase subunit NuoN [Marinitenerispora sediminis]|uniref:NADH-quinone oxidoreductase subunit N n=1 Tax=Marinitenerispora sediminis TaxID=1931232 RepID=A0A368TAG2_9ACTN|nr:NADH-quinone oxidoreductase subunit NuoN [Marinitenerispora sediminis]RCV60050.1 NADH-quinone oxidoreductase subunit NuoN [Marinitenerispora sediminis]RCV61957.1 NADH-quinone oxidoreductase subunit NuoN [Marinitenerispora sediminis]